MAAESLLDETITGSTRLGQCTGTIYLNLLTLPRGPIMGQGESYGRVDNEPLNQ